KQPGPYRMSQEHLLPRFAPVSRCPERPQVNGSAAAAIAAPMPVIAAAAAIAAPPIVATATAPAEMPNPFAEAGMCRVEAERRDGEQDANTVQPRVKRAKQDGGRKGFSALAFWLRGLVQRRPRESAAPAVVKRPIQGELSLDLVKVVRNDLRDS